jgi:hypothetical protein
LLATGEAETIPVLASVTRPCRATTIERLSFLNTANRVLGSVRLAG